MSVSLKVLLKCELIKAPQYLRSKYSHRH